MPKRELAPYDLAKHGEVYLLDPASSAVWDPDACLASRLGGYIFDDSLPPTCRSVEIQRRAKCILEPLPLFPVQISTKGGPVKAVSNRLRRGLTGFGDHVGHAQCLEAEGRSEPSPNLDLGPITMSRHLLSANDADSMCFERRIRRRLEGAGAIHSPSSSSLDAAGSPECVLATPEQALWRRDGEANSTGLPLDCDPSRQRSSDSRSFENHEDEDFLCIRSREPVEPAVEDLVLEKENQHFKGVPTSSSGGAVVGDQSTSPTPCQPGRSSPEIWRHSVEARASRPNAVVSVLSPESDTGACPIGQRGPVSLVFEQERVRRQIFANEATLPGDSSGGEAVGRHTLLPPLAVANESSTPVLPPAELVESGCKVARRNGIPSDHCAVGLIKSASVENADVPMPPACTISTTGVDTPLHSSVPVDLSKLEHGTGQRPEMAAPVCPKNVVGLLQPALQAGSVCTTEKGTVVPSLHPVNLSKLDCKAMCDKPFGRLADAERTAIAAHLLRAENGHSLPALAPVVDPKPSNGLRTESVFTTRTGAPLPALAPVDLSKPGFEIGERNVVGNIVDPKPSNGLRTESVFTTGRGAPLPALAPVDLSKPRVGIGGRSVVGSVVDPKPGNGLRTESVFTTGRGAPLPALAPVDLSKPGCEIGERNVVGSVADPKPSSGLLTESLFTTGRGAPLPALAPVDLSKPRVKIGERGVVGNVVDPKPSKGLRTESVFTTGRGAPLPALAPVDLSKPRVEIGERSVVGNVVDPKPSNGLRTESLFTTGRGAPLPALAPVHLSKPRVGIGGRSVVGSVVDPKPGNGLRTESVFTTGRGAPLPALAPVDLSKPGFEIGERNVVGNVADPKPSSGLLTESLFTTGRGAPLPALAPVDLSKPRVEIGERSVVGNVVDPKPSNGLRTESLFRTGRGAVLPALQPCDLSKSGYRAPERNVIMTSGRISSDRIHEKNHDTPCMNGMHTAIGIAMSAQDEVPIAQLSSRGSVVRGSIPPRECGFTTPRPSQLFRSGASSGSLGNDVGTPAIAGSRPPLLPTPTGIQPPRSDAGRIGICFNPRRLWLSGMSPKPCQVESGSFRTPSGAKRRFGVLGSSGAAMTGSRSGGSLLKTGSRSGGSSLKSGKFKPPRRIAGKSPRSFSASPVSVSGLPKEKIPLLLRSGEIVRDTGHIHRRTISPSGVYPSRALVTAASWRWLYDLVWSPFGLAQCIDFRFSSSTVGDPSLLPMPISEKVARSKASVDLACMSQVVLGVDDFVEWISGMFLGIEQKSATRVGSVAWSRMVYSISVSKHARFALAKLQSGASTEVVCKSFTAGHVARDFLRRIEREWTRPRTPVLLQMLRKDMSPASHVVLLVTSVVKEACGSFSLELSDGWHVARAKLDSALSLLVASKRIDLWDKLHVSLASLVSSSSSKPFFFGDGDELGCALLALRINGVRAVKRGKLSCAKLGSQGRRKVVFTSLSSVYPGGGRIPWLIVVILRVYPVMFRERSPGDEGHWVWRRREGEERAAEAFVEKLREREEQKRLSGVAIDCDDSGNEAHHREVRCSVEFLVTGVADAMPVTRSSAEQHFSPENRSSARGLADERMLVRVFEPPECVLEVLRVGQALVLSSSSLADYGGVSTLDVDPSGLRPADSEWVVGRKEADALVTCPIMRSSQLYAGELEVGNDFDGVFAVVQAGPLSDCGTKRFIFLADELCTSHVVALELSGDDAVHVPQALGRRCDETGICGRKLGVRDKHISTKSEAGGVLIPQTHKKYVFLVGLRDAKFTGASGAVGIVQVTATRRTSFIPSRELSATGNARVPRSRHKSACDDRMREAARIVKAELEAPGAATVLEMLSESVSAIVSGEKETLRAWYSQTQE